MGEAMRMESFRKTPHALLSRAAAGVCGKSLIVNLPGSPRGALECLEVILPALPHAVELVQGRVDQCDPSSGEEGKESR
jgi:molybdopterin biosynthesis enzyme MoaB